MSEIIDFKSEIQASSYHITDDEIRLANIHDVVVGLIIGIEQKQFISMEILKEQMFEIIKIIHEEL